MVVNPALVAASGDANRIGFSPTVQCFGSCVTRVGTPPRLRLVVRRERFAVGRGRFRRRCLCRLSLLLRSIAELPPVGRAVDEQRRQAGPHE
jgi:hypothetical protein